MIFARLAAAAVVNQRTPARIAISKNAHVSNRIQGNVGYLSSDCKWVARDLPVVRLDL